MQCSCWTLLTPSKCQTSLLAVKYLPSLKVPNQFVGCEVSPFPQSAKPVCWLWSISLPSKCQTSLLAVKISPFPQSAKPVCWLWSISLPSKCQTSLLAVKYLPSLKVPNQFVGCEVPPFPQSAKPFVGVKYLHYGFIFDVETHSHWTKSCSWLWCYHSAKEDLREWQWAPFYHTFPFCANVCQRCTVLTKEN